MAPLIVEQMAQMILGLKTQGVSVLLSEQNMPFAEPAATEPVRRAWLGV